MSIFVAAVIGVALVAVVGDKCSCRPMIQMDRVTSEVLCRLFFRVVVVVSR